MYATHYHRATSLDEAVSKLGGAEDGKFLGGGQTLLATMKQRLAAPSDIVDVTRIPELSGISREGDQVVIGAATTHHKVNTSAEVKQAIPALATLAGLIGDPAVRNMGTIGGSIANNDPAADYPAGLLGLNATVHTNKRALSADEFFAGMFETALEDDEIVVKVSFPIPEKAAYEKFPNPASRYAMCGVMAAKLKDGSVRVAVTGAGADGVFRVPEMEQALSSNWSPDAVAGITVSANDMMGDLHGSAEYRAHLVTVMAKRAVAAAG
ncbi:FAD binding domain-containing protein [Amorphus orientalis]|uniref:Carbon-monoxide dehydrogenase medium subunit n=1 Tax=Amorphus orientalis TaxID=649198 RepID=A0AAE3VTP9_9HYPH|nr:xanthine dehydrogenase family protein subunit M [Amorphus orientalis]MDQ0317643.1 carbon-monoxide dehydrogenase medium subunit [Amorphus orientalis]